MSTFTRPAFIDGAKVVALSLTLGAVLAFVPVFSIAAAPLLPVPVALVITRHGVVLGIIASLVTGAMAFVLTGFAAGLLVFMLVGLAGVGAGICLKRGFSQFGLFVSMALMFFLLLFLWMGSLLAVAGVSPVSAMEMLADRTIEPTRELYLSLGMNQQDVDGIISDARNFVVALPYLAPALLLVLSVTLSGASVAVARRVFERLRQPFPRDFTFRNLRVHFGFAYMMITGMLCQLSAPYLPETYGQVAELAGANLLIITEVVFFVQGMAIASYFLWRHQVSKIKKSGVYAGLVLLQATLSLTSWLGLFDTWLDYRRRFDKRTA